MARLKPALEQRGFEVAIFHATGMGGMAFEKIASQRGFVCVMDFASSTKSIDSVSKAIGILKGFKSPTLIKLP